MQITVEYLKEKNACICGLNWYKNQKEKDVIKIIRKLIADKDKIRSEYNGDYFTWANWLISRVLSKIDGVKYAVFAAEKVLHIFEKKHPEDSRPRAAIEAAKNFIKNPNKENANAANAAYATANAASAAYAAYAAASAYTYKSAAAVVNAAYNAANAASAAADAALKIAIINYGVELLKKY